MIQDLHRQGLSIRAIARRTGRCPKTIRKALKAELEPPVYGPRAPRPSILDPFKDYIRTRLEKYPDLTATRLGREIKELGYSGKYTTVKTYIATVRPDPEPGFEHRFETPAGQQAQVDFAYFQVTFTDAPEELRVVWLFSMVLGHSRFLFARFVNRQNLDEVVRCHIRAFTRLGGVPQRILYDRMKTAVIGDGDDGSVIFNTTLLDLAAHFGFTPKACRPYRAKTKGKVERPFRYIRQDFFLGRTFRNLDDLNNQLATWLDQLANRRRHGTTGRIVQEAFAEEQPALQALPALAFRSVLKLERRITKDGMVSVDGNLYSVPDGTRRRPVEVQVMADEVRIHEDGRLIAVHPPLAGKGQRSLLPGHRKRKTPRPSSMNDGGGITRGLDERPGDTVPTRPLQAYDDAAKIRSQGALTGVGRVS